MTYFQVSLGGPEDQSLVRIKIIKNKKKILITRDPGGVQSGPGGGALLPQGRHRQERGGAGGHLHHQQHPHVRRQGQSWNVKEFSPDK